MTFEPFAIRAQIFSGFFIQRVGGIRFKEEELPLLVPVFQRIPDPKLEKQTNLHAHNNRIQIQNRLPILPKNIQAHIPLQVDIGMIDLLRALDLRRIVWEVLVDGKSKVEEAALVHAFVGFDGEGEVEDVVGVGEVHFHGTTQG